MTVEQKTITLRPRPRGFHLVTDEILREVPELRRFQAGLAHFFILHTSASLTVNENADPDVRMDMEEHFRRSVPDDTPYFRHTLEGGDDMTAHIKSSMMGVSLTVPVSNGSLLLGTWQGIYLCEHRERGGARRVAVTIIGDAIDHE